MTEKAANECGSFILPNVHHHEAIASMAEPRQIETSIAGEESDIPLPPQENDDLIVLHPFTADINSYLPRR